MTKWTRFASFIALCGLSFYTAACTKSIASQPEQFLATDKPDPLLSSTTYTEAYPALQTGNNGAANLSPTEETVNGYPLPISTGATATISDAVLMDAGWYARQYGVSLEEAYRRLTLQDEIGDLGAKLARNEVSTFAGLWIEHEPIYRVVIAFTRNGKETLAPYIVDTPLAELIELRVYEMTYAELEELQQELNRLFEAHNISVNTGINIMQNQVEIFVPDVEQFFSMLEAQEINLPEQVSVVEMVVEEW